MTRSLSPAVEADADVATCYICGNDVDEDDVYTAVFFDSGAEGGEAEETLCRACWIWPEVEL